MCITHHNLDLQGLLRHRLVTLNIMFNMNLCKPHNYTNLLIQTGFFTKVYSDLKLLQRGFEIAISPCVCNYNFQKISERMQTTMSKLIKQAVVTDVLS